jgi:hypothetical protein
VSDHTQSIPRVGGAASGAPKQGAQSAGGSTPKTSSPATPAIPTNGSAANARTAAPPAARTTTPPAARTGVANKPWSPAPARTPGVPPPPATAKSGAVPPVAKKSSANRRGDRGPRKARLQLRHVDTWSALKISLVLSVVMFFVWMVAVGILYGVLSQLNVFDEINKLWGQLGAEDGSTTELITPSLIFGGAAVIGAINIVLFTALATIATYIYNLSADLVGGLEVTLTERE